MTDHVAGFDLGTKLFLYVGRLAVQHKFTEEEISRIIEMAWEDRTPFEAIEASFGINESTVIKLMRYEMKYRSFKVWRKRVSGRVTKHGMKRPAEVSRGYCPTQYKVR